MKKTQTTDGIEIIDQRFFRNQAERRGRLAEIESEDEVARKIHKLRNEAGLSQRDLARIVGTTASVICRLEDADYDGHSMAMLRRIAAALHKRVEIRFVSIREVPRKA